MGTPYGYVTLDATIDASCERDELTVGIARHLYDLLAKACLTALTWREPDAFGIGVG